MICKKPPSVAEIPLTLSAFRPSTMARSVHPRHSPYGTSRLDGCEQRYTIRESRSVTLTSPYHFFRERAEMETLARRPLIEASVILSDLRGSNTKDALGPKRIRLIALSSRACSLIVSLLARCDRALHVAYYCSDCSQAQFLCRSATDTSALCFR
jgi:hypothetical protein